MICFVDFETTGIDIFRDEPIEIGAVLVDENLTIKKEYSSKIAINKSVYLTKRAFKIHNISSEEASQSRLPKEVMVDFFQSLGTDYRFGGWNINFDVSFFRKLCHKSGLMVKYNKINHRHLDIQTIGFLTNQLGLLPTNQNSLSDWIQYFGLKRGSYHSALEDSKLTLEVYKSLLSILKVQIK